MQGIYVLASEEFLGIKIFDTDLYKMVLLLGINFVMSFILIRLVYYPNSNRKKEYLFTFMLISTIVFFLAFALKSFKFNTGIALGLFAIFGIIRFRTTVIPVKEMSYFFAVIGIALVNALSNKMSLIEVGVVDVSVLVLTFIMEKFLNTSAEGVEEDAKMKRGKFKTKEIVYGNLNRVKPENRVKLLEDIRFKTGLNITKVEVGSLNLKKGEANLVLFYLED
jgi:hypothetical protein